MFNCIINKSSYFNKSTPMFESKILYPVPTNSLSNIKPNEKTKKIKSIEYLKENANTKHSSEITTSSNQNTKINNTMKIYSRDKSNKNLLNSKENIIKHLFRNNPKNYQNLKFFCPNTFRNTKINQKKSIVFNSIDKPLLILKFQYLDYEKNISVFLNDDGLKIAVKINSIFNLNLKECELEKCGLIITKYINKFIDLKRKNKEINSFGAVIDLKEIINKCRKKKITAEFNGRYYCYFITNSIEEINEITEDIFKKLNKQNKYNQNNLKKEIKSSILNIINKSQSEISRYES